MINKALKKELAGIISNVRIQHVLPLHSDLLESTIERRVIDRGMPLDIGEGSFYPTCPWMRRRHDKDFVKPRLFLPYYEEAKVSKVSKSLFMLHFDFEWRRLRGSNIYPRKRIPNSKSANLLCTRS